MLSVCDLLSCEVLRASLCLRFRSHLSDTYGVLPTQKPLIYCGRGRPPKRALLNAGFGMQLVGETLVAYTSGWGGRVANDAYDNWSNRMERAVTKGKRMKELMKGQPLPVNQNTLRKNPVRRHRRTKMTC